MSRPGKAWERFAIIRELGAGAFGRTLLVKDTTQNDRCVVIKVPHNREKEEALIKELINNAALTASMGGMAHPNIVRFLGFDRFEDYYVMIMEYVEGMNLRRIIGPCDVNRSPMEIERALKITRAICSALVAAHRAKLMHRDIKPGNIVVRDADGVAKLLDFGISKIVQSSHLSGGTFAGTVPYMAPESIACNPDFSSDLWSLSVTLYELVTGRLPFWDENDLAVRRKIETADPIPPREYNPKIDESLNALILKGLEKDLKSRFRTAQEMLNALGSDLDEEIMAIRRKFHDGNEEEAERQVHKLLEGEPLEPRLYMLMGEFYNSRQRFFQSEEIIRKGIAVCPTYAGLYFYLAPALWSQGLKKQPDAIAALERALELGLNPAHERQARNLLMKWKISGDRS